MMRNLIPFDKSWIIRIGLLDLIHGYQDIQKFLADQTDLSEDLQALKRACEMWGTATPIDVGESGTLLRFLRVASWRQGLQKTFVMTGTLKDRQIADDPRIANLTQREALNIKAVLGIDEKPTSQWASGLAILGDAERLSDAPFKLRVTYEAVDHWRTRREQAQLWEAREDKTIRMQADAFLMLLRGHRPAFVPAQAEDYCFARAFGYITKEEGERNWPNLRGHESDRIEEMEQTLAAAEAGEEIVSRDHRPVQAIVLWSFVNHRPINICHPEAVRKTWPQFWEFVAKTTEAL